jgi:hypothetical protein
MNREAWLEAAGTEIGALLAEQGLDVPKYRVSVGWPSKGGTSTKKRRVGECWKPEATDDGISQVYISPTLEKPLDVLGVLVHEVIHAVVQVDTPDAGHRGPFVAAAKGIGLTGPWTATSVGPELLPVLEGISARLGEYPHVKINPSVQAPVQTTRMLKVQCPVCEYTVRTTQKWLDAGNPSCPDGDEMFEVVKK